MPKYDYRCSECDRVTEEHRNVDDRQLNGICPHCKSDTEFVFPLGGFALWTFEPYYDEALDMDIRSRGEKKEVLRALGLQEAGDKVGGARNFDKDAEYVRADQPLSGRTYDDHVKEQELAKEARDWAVGVETGGQTDFKKVSDLKAPSPSEKVHGKAKPVE